MRKQTTTTDQTIDTARRPKVGHYLGFAFLAIVLVLGYSYLSWTSVNASSMLPKSIRDEISWVSEEKSAVKTVGEESTQKTDLRERLLDLRGKLGDSFDPELTTLHAYENQKRTYRANGVEFTSGTLRGDRVVQLLRVASLIIAPMRT